ncbi:hypothetical protein GCM10010129_42100 [Streptomyces fumigatiscleroticus]|nr:hypothetical protein GCM10010129_42100 [Streptomyces fumigatiscleroticus]
MPECAPPGQPLTGELDPATADGTSTPAPLPPCLAVMETVPDGDRMLVRVRGELDLGGHRLRPGLHDALCRSGSGVDLDLSAVEFCDCAGLNVLLEERRRALEQDKTLAIRSSSPAVARLLELTGAWELFAHPGPDDPAAPTGGGPRGDADQDLRTEVVQLRRAMQTRPTIDLARGILMASFGLTSQAAWTVLVTTSQNTNTKLHRLAHDLVSAADGTALPQPVRTQLAAAIAGAGGGPTSAPAGPAAPLGDIEPKRCGTPPGDSG